MDNVILRFDNLIEKNPLKAIHIMKQAIHENPGKAEYLSVYGLYLCKNGHLDAGVQLLEKSQQIQPLESETTFGFAIALMKQDRYLGAIKNFRMVEALYPEALYNSAICYLRLNKFHKAIEQAKKLTKIDILAKEAYILMVDVMLIDFRDKQAEKVVAEYLEKYGKDETYHFIAGNVTFNKMDYTFSAFHYSKILDSNINQAHYYSKYAMSLYRSKQYRKAIEAYENVLKSDNYVEYDVICYARSLYEVERYQEVLDLLDRHKAFISDSSTSRELRAKSYYKLNQS